LMKEIDVRVSQGETISDEGKKVYLAKAYEIHQQLLPQMESKRQGIQKQLAAIQKTKLARQTYYESGPNGYGAFFDRKK
jgi:flagellar protein FliT